ncbi:S1C family serine protease [Amycolatopsis aidingensis]|uniref:S1C family serine protease n=1 Tax=Amycolatopsis aidingensis TaxID=2842453 RepID=UPI001E386836|nr:trypsin-like peptidase domain-containing protein [Amycolatopsis aidingensis]
MSRLSFAAVSLCCAAVTLVGCTGEPGENAAGDPGTQQNTAPAQGEGIGASYANVVEQVAPSVVTVRTERGVGSGVVFREDVVLTNRHVVAGRSSVRIGFADGTESAGEVLATDRITDLAVIRTERAGLPVAKFRTELPRPGDRVLALGSPLGLQNTVTAGIVSGLHREVPGASSRTHALVDLIQTDAPISPGNSGGALVDVQGRVIGINEAYLPPESGAVSIGFAIPSATAQEVAKQLLADGTAEHPYLGVSLAQLTPSIREQLGVQVEQGALVQRVEEGGPAAKAGLRTGDVIVQFGDTKVAAVEDVLGALRGTEPGQQVTLTVARGSERQQIEVTVGTRSG